MYTFTTTLNKTAPSNRHQSLNMLPSALHSLNDLIRHITLSWAALQLSKRILRIRGMEVTYLCHYSALMQKSKHFMEQN